MLSSLQPFRPFSPSSPDPPASASRRHAAVQDFIEELDHLQKLAEMLTDSPVTESMAHTFMAKIQGCQSWSSESICEMLAKANQASRLPAALQEKILNTIQNLSMNTGSQLKLKLVNSGQSVLRLCPYLTRTDWTSLGSQKKAPRAKQSPLLGRAGTAQAALPGARPSTRRSHRHSAGDHSTKASLALAVAAKQS